MVKKVLRSAEKFSEPFPLSRRYPSTPLQQKLLASVVCLALTTLWHIIITYEKLFWSSYFRKITNLMRNSLKSLSFRDIVRAQNPSKITKNNSQGIIFVIILCQCKCGNSNQRRSCPESPKYSGQPCSTELTMLCNWHGPSVPPPIRGPLFPDPPRNPFIDVNKGVPGVLGSFGPKCKSRGPCGRTVFILFVTVHLCLKIDIWHHKLLADVRLEPKHRKSEAEWLTMTCEVNSKPKEDRTMIECGKATEMLPWPHCKWPGKLREFWAIPAQSA